MTAKKAINNPEPRGLFKRDSQKNQKAFHRRTEDSYRHGSPKGRNLHCRTLSKTWDSGIYC